MGLGLGCVPQGLCALLRIEARRCLRRWSEARKEANLRTAIFERWNPFKRYLYRPNAPRFLLRVYFWAGSLDVFRVYIFLLKSCWKKYRPWWFVYLPVSAWRSSRCMSLPLFCGILWLDWMLVKITLMSFHHFFRFKVGCIWGDLGCKNPNRLELGKKCHFSGQKVIFRSWKSSRNQQIQWRPAPIHHYHLELPPPTEKNMMKLLDLLDDCTLYTLPQRYGW